MGVCRFAYVFWHFASLISITVRFLTCFGHRCYTLIRCWYDVRFVFKFKLIQCNSAMDSPFLFHICCSSLSRYLYLESFNCINSRCSTEGQLIQRSQLIRFKFSSCLRSPIISLNYLPLYYYCLWVLTKATHDVPLISFYDDLVGHLKALRKVDHASFQVIAF